MKQNKDPYSITDVYFLEMNAVDAATVTVGDLTERLSNDFDTASDAYDFDEINDFFSTKNVKNKNSISFANGADGGYSVWVGVDDKNKVRKIIASANMSDYIQHHKDRQSYFSFESEKTKMNDQFFPQSGFKKSRIKLFDLKTQSGLIAVGDHGGPLRFLLGVNDDLIDEIGNIKDFIDTKYFLKDGIYQNNVPIFIVNFSYGLVTTTENSSFATSSMHETDTKPFQEQINYSYTELFNNLLDETCYPTKYIFEKYLIEKKEYDPNYHSDFNLIIKKDAILSGEYISNRLPKALQILKKQTKILFKDNFDEVFEIRKKQFEDFIHGIIKDIEPQELNLPTFGKKEIKKKLSNKKLEIKSTDGISHLFDGYKFKDDSVGFDLSNIIFPVKKGSYPTYLHIYSEDEDEEQYTQVKIVVEGIEGCYLNKDENCKLIVNNKPKESKNITNVIKNKIKSIVIDKIDLRNSNSLKELEKLKHIEKLTLANLSNLEDWSPVKKLKNLKHLHLDTCSIGPGTSGSFFKAIYSLPNLEKLSLDEGCYLQRPNDILDQNLYPKKLKDFEIIYDENTKNEKPPETYENYKGYAAAKGSHHIFDAQIIHVNELPNFEKIKTLEKLRFYNFFDIDEEEGYLFDREYEFEFNSSDTVTKFCENTKLKDIWIYGYNFNKAEELANTKFLDFAINITGNSKVKVNGINKETLQKIYYKGTVENADSIIIVDDNCGYNKSKTIDDIQLFKLEDLQDALFDGQALPKINNGTKDFPIKELRKSKKDINRFEYFFDEEGLYNYSTWANSLTETYDFNHFVDNASFEKRLVFVKKSFLDKNKKVLFKNVKHLYYYCLRESNEIRDEHSIFWKKNERFKIPDSVKIDNLETLHLSCGRHVSFKEIEKICGSSLKILIIDDMLVDDCALPKFPNLEKILINYGNVGMDLTPKDYEKFGNFRNFFNAPKLNRLEIYIPNSDHIGVEFSSLKLNKELKELKIFSLNPKFVKDISKLKSLTSLEITLMDDKNKVTEKDFEFLKSLKNLKKIKISGGYISSVLINFKDVITFLNKDIEEVSLDIVYLEDSHIVAYECIKEINKSLKNLKKLTIDISSVMSDNVESYNNYDVKLKFAAGSGYGNYFDKITKEKSTNTKYQFNFDLKNLNNLKKLEEFTYRNTGAFSTKLLNEDKLLKLPNLKRIVTHEKYFSNNFFKNIKKRQDDYLNKCRKLKKYKNSTSYYQLEGKEWETFDKLRIFTGYGYSGESASDILSNRKVKKK